MTEFSKLKTTDFQFDPVRKIGFDWMLITAGTSEKCNTMTASWGGTGFLWNKPVAFIFVRPQRFTYKFIEENKLFTCSFLSKQYKKALSFCGEHSGREVDKFKHTGLNLTETAEGAIAIEESELVIVCRKIYYQDIDPEGFMDASLIKNYPDKDYHRLYIGEIISVLKRNNY